MTFINDKHGVNFEAGYGLDAYMELAELGTLVRRGENGRGGALS